MWSEKTPVRQCYSNRLKDALFSKFPVVAHLSRQNYSWSLNCLSPANKVVGRKFFQLCLSIHKGFPCDLPWNLFTWATLASIPTHIGPPPILALPPGLFKLAHYVAHKSIRKWAVRLRLKGLPVQPTMSPRH